MDIKKETFYQMSVNVLFGVINIQCQHVTIRTLKTFRFGKLKKKIRGKVIFQCQKELSLIPGFYRFFLSELFQILTTVIKPQIWFHCRFAKMQPFVFVSILLKCHVVLGRKRSLLSTDSFFFFLSACHDFFLLHA